MKKIFVLFVLSILLVSCGTEEEKANIQRDGKEKTDTELTQSGVIKERKKGEFSSSNDFLIETKILDELNSFTYIEKIGQVISDQSIDVKSQVSGRLSNIYIREGGEVYKGQYLAKITDTYSKYYLDLEKAQIDYEKQLINKESQLVTLEKNITNAEISLNEAKNNYDNAKLTAKEDIKKAKLDYESSDLIDINSEAYLELEKAKLDYENLLTSNKQTLNTHIDNVSKEYNNLVLDLTDVIKFGDELFGITTLNKNKNDSFDDYLGAKNISLKNETIELLITLISYKETINNLDISVIEESNLVEFMDSYYDGYDKIKLFLSYLEKTLDNSISSVGSLSKSDIDSYLSQVNSYQNSNQGNISSFSNINSSINSFLNTYKNLELSSLKNVELQELKLGNTDESSGISYNKTLVSIENSLNSYETKYKQAELTYNNALKNKEVTIKSLDNSIQSSKNSLSIAEVEYSKLIIKSPISGVVSNINIDNNADVSNSTNLFTLISDNNTGIEISLNSTEIEKITIGDKVQIEYLGEILEGEIYSKSRVANENLEYKILISLNQKINLIGGSTIVKIKSENDSILLPLDIVEITGDNTGYIYYYKDGKNNKLELELGKINGGSVQILSEIDENIEIITTDLSTYNSLTQNLKINNN